MANENPKVMLASPFHSGEQQVQERLGVRERMERFGRKVIRNYLTEQHREFYRQLPFITVGHVDAEGRPWASLIAGKPGFLQSPNDGVLNVLARPVDGDPLAAAPQDTALGLLGLEPATRRRNRLNGVLKKTAEGGFAVSVRQSFGNCPQYIHARTVEFVEPPNAVSKPEAFSVLDAEAQRMIEGADTFFVSSATPANYSNGEESAAAVGADVSHRGGRPGFVGVDGDGLLVIPDFSGNHHYNTLGNFVVNPRAGLLFVDFDSGSVLMLTGTVEIVWEGPEVDAFQGAARLWRFRLTSGIRLRDRLPIRMRPGDTSLNNSLTGTWAQSQSRLAAAGQDKQWRAYEVLKIVDETPTIRSLYLQLADGEALATYRAGQHLPLRVECEPGSKSLVRTYTLSSAPGDPHYRISVKREPGGVVSNYLHDNLVEGDRLEAQAPRGTFTFSPSGSRPALLLSGGVGITPMISMLRDTVQERLRCRQARGITFLHSAESTAFRPFREETRTLAAASEGTVFLLSAIGKPQHHEEAGSDFDHVGRIDSELLQKILPTAPCDVFLCGPPGFMQAMYDAVRALQIPDDHIFAEAFGPSSLRRLSDAETPSQVAPSLPCAEEALVELRLSKVERLWTKEDGSLLDFAEKHGVNPDFACRGGFCGTCAVRVVSGNVSYPMEPLADIPEGHALLCTALPAVSSEGESKRLVLDI